MRLGLAVIGLWLVVGLAADGDAQEVRGPGEAFNLFFDCQGFGCWDMDFFRREIPYINWVRDREVSDVHVLVTTQTTGGGGTSLRARVPGPEGFRGARPVAGSEYSG